jgi:hypothetical protein
MTTFSYPLNVKRTNPDASGVGAVQGKTPFYMQRKVSVGDTGTAVGSTTIPLFVAPAGSRVWDAALDVITVFNPAASNTNLAVGVPTSTGIIFAATTVNTAGRRTQTMSGAQVSANAVVFSADTTIQAIVSIDTSTVSTGEVLITVILI